MQRASQLLKKNVYSMLLASLLMASHSVFAGPVCLDIFDVFAGTQAGKASKKKNEIDPELADKPIVQAMLGFAQKHDLPHRVVEFGPEGHKQKRLIVPIDVTNEKLLQDYREAFHLETQMGDKKGALVLEFTSETPQINGHYVTGVLRTSSKPEDPIYRWNKEDVTLKEWWTGWFLSNAAPVKESGILGFSHILPLSEAQLKNLKTFIDPKKEEERGPCKSDNCVAWVSNIELGKTSKESTTEQRDHLFTHLGMSRTMAHFEIGRRLIHAANDRHAGFFVFVDGAKGNKAFKGDLKDVIPPDPKIPYTNIIKGMGPEAQALKAVEIVPDGAKVFFPIAAGASAEAMQALAQKARDLENGLDIHVLVNGISERVFLDAMEAKENKVRIHALFLGGNLRKLYSQGRVNYIPGNLSDFTRMMRNKEIDTFDYDVIVVRVSPANNKGEHSLGPNNDMIMSILKARPDIKVIAEINENIPFTKGKNFLTKDQIHASFESKSELAGPAVVPLTEVEVKIGQQLGELVSSGSTLQIGIGNIFGGLPQGLQKQGVKDLKIVTEMFGDPLKEVMDLGIAKKAETGFVYGSQELYRWLDGNRNIEIKETEEVNDMGRVMATPQFHAINTALQVSLLGEVNATMGPKGRLSSPGGQVEFMTGASRSEDGKAIIAIRSTAKEGELSTIVLDLYKGPITTPHEAVTHVVTEYGIATLRGKNESQRAIELINIAHPKFRAELKEQALKQKMISEEQARQVKVEE